MSVNEHLMAERTYHGRDKIKGPHSNANVLIVNASEDRVLMLRHKMRMRRDDLDHGKQRNVLHCISLSDDSALHLRNGTHNSDPYLE
jgi:predicted AAA+ superfamily ATPase